MDSLVAGHSAIPVMSHLPVPMVEGKVAAGFPSPADDFAVHRLDLNELLITHPPATFFWRVSGRY